MNRLADMALASVAHCVGYAITMLAYQGLRGLTLGYMLLPTSWAEISKFGNASCRSRENLTQHPCPISY